MANLGTGFYQKLVQIGQRTGLKPEDLLLVMCMESGLSPTARNPEGNASGLVQFMPFVLKNLGFKGTDADFRKLNGEAQLDYVEKLVQGMTKYNGGPFKSATQYYVGNFFPVALQLPGVKAEDPNTIIIEQNPTKKKYSSVSINYEKLVYKINSALDSNKDGNITYGDLMKKLNSMRNTGLYQKALADLKTSANYTPAPAPQPQNVEKNMPINNFPMPVAKPTQKPDILNVVNDLLKAASVKIKSPVKYHQIEFANLVSIAFEEYFGKSIDVLSNDSGIFLPYSNDLLKLAKKIVKEFEISANKDNAKINLSISYESNLKPISAENIAMAHRKMILRMASNG